MTPEQKALILPLIQELTEESVKLGRLSQEDDLDNRPWGQRGSTHEQRLEKGKEVVALREKINGILTDATKRKAV
jgi:hypothetical protein